MVSTDEAPALDQPQGISDGNQRDDLMLTDSALVPEGRNMFPSMEAPDLCDFEVVQAETQFTETNSEGDHRSSVPSQTPRTLGDPAAGDSATFQKSGRGSDFSSSVDGHIKAAFGAHMSSRSGSGTISLLKDNNHSAATMCARLETGTVPTSTASVSSHRICAYNYRDETCEKMFEEENTTFQFSAGLGARNGGAQDVRSNDFGAECQGVFGPPHGTDNLPAAPVKPGDAGLLAQMNQTVQMMQQQLEEQAFQMKHLTALVNEMSTKLDLIHDGLSPSERQSSVNSSVCRSRDGRPETTNVVRGRIVPPPLPRERSQDAAAPTAGSRSARYNAADAQYSDRYLDQRNAIAAQRQADAEALERKRLEELREMERRKEEERKRKEEEERRKQEEAARRAAEEQRRREELDAKRKNIMSSLISGQVARSSLFGDDSGPTTKNSLFDD
ncbi:hypothetical protein BESB_054600 [Besnoitia besnoiti]|uniref:Uncharacterized protein n=1 Tax=Besnoitia besnoiti TaxID=94643 RepID=A0A2A9MD53_BESBE|nr:hypothetical protein BESB_054600 [Besnoitia besnoiti]PFH35809.1 hypothetical protein BESB_054600 [Besnoitia besnoiti]